MPDLQTTEFDPDRYLPLPADKDQDRVPGGSPIPGVSDDGSSVDDFTKRFSPERVDALGHTLADITRQQAATEAKTNNALEYRLEQDRLQAERAFRAESAGPDSIPPPWNADKERQQRISDPIQNFGSLASVFGILASMFTKTPLTSALNASAAAMNSIRNHDEEGYKSAYQAWKDNTELALKRFNMERDLFEDANKLVTTDITQWKTRQLAIAAQFNNQKAIAMLDAGMDKELIETQEAQVRAAAGLQKAKEDFETYDLRRTIYQSEVKAWDQAHPDAKPQEKARARLEILQGIAEGGKNVAVDILRQYRLDNPHATAEQEADFLKEHQVGARGLAGGAGSTLTKLRGELAEREEKQAATGEDDPLIPILKKAITDAEGTKPAPPGKVLDEKKQVIAYDESLNKIDEAIKSLESHVGEAGLAGRGTRLAERVGNIFGSNKTDREQFMRTIEFLRGAAPKLLFDRSGRPLAADADRVNDIVGGISLGDTTANTIRSLKELRDAYQRLRKQNVDLLGGTWTPESSEGPSKPAAPTGKSPWDSDPIMQPAAQ